jgi:AMP-activated protein kinase-like protein
VSDVERDELIGRLAAELRKPVAVDPAFDARLMAAIRADSRGASPSRLGSAWRWLVRPRTFSLSPLSGLALAAGLAGLVVLSTRDRRAGGGSGDNAAQFDRQATAVVPATAAAKVMQLFVYVGPRANSVALVGDFNDWDPAATPMHASSTGVWSVQFPLAPGRHEYAFLVDGKHWAIDPAAPSAPADDFGSPNSVITIADATS